MQTINLTASDTAYVSKIQSKKNFSGSAVLKIGLEKVAFIDRFCLVTENRALIKFNLSALSQASSIISAGLHVYMESQKRKGCGGFEVEVLRNTTEFDGSVTWDTMPETEKTGRRICFAQSDVPGYVSCDITGLAVGWQEGKTRNYGITLIMDILEGDFLQAASLHSQNPPFLLLQIQECRMEKLEAKNREYVFNILHCQGECYSPVIDLFSAQNATFFIQNNTDGVMEANLEISPDSEKFIKDAQTVSIPAGDMGVITPYYFSRYCRVHLFGRHCGCGPAAKIWCQVQTRNYYLRSL